MHSCWRSWGHSMIGPLHQKNGLPNQDAWLARHYSWGDVVVVSDGLGSKPHADTGAKMACRAVCEAAKFYQKNTSAPLEELTRLIHAMWLIFISLEIVQQHAYLYCAYMKTSLQVNWGMA